MKRTIVILLAAAMLLSVIGCKKAAEKTTLTVAMSPDFAPMEFVDLSKKHENFIRFSYKVASLYDAAARYIENVAAGKDPEDEIRAVEAAFEKQFSVCPKCGRTLIRPGIPQKQAGKPRRLA